jgi:predicted DNA-binding transcriptional regulator YafY
MTLTELAGTAAGTDDDPINLTPDEARDIVAQAEAADERCHDMAARFSALEKRNAELQASNTRLRDLAQQLLDAFIRQTTGINELTEQLAAALDPKAGS